MADKQRLHIDSSGEGPPLVLIHSLLTDARAYDGFAALLQHRYRLHRIWLAGFGPSAPVAADAAPTVHDLGAMVAESLAAAGTDRDAAVLGNGLGAFVAVAMAIDAGGDLGPLIVANGGAAFSQQRRGAFEVMARLVSDAGMEAVVDTAVGRIFTEEYLRAHPEAKAQRRNVLTEIDPVSFAACCRALHGMDLRPDLHQIAVPSLIIAGAADETTPPEMSVELAESLDDAELVVLDGCGHCPPLQQPAALAEAVDDFLNRHLPR